MTELKVDELIATYESEVEAATEKLLAVAQEKIQAFCEKYSLRLWSGMGGFSLECMFTDMIPVREPNDYMLGTVKAKYPELYTLLNYTLSGTHRSVGECLDCINVNERVDTVPAFIHVKNLKYDEKSIKLVTCLGFPAEDEYDDECYYGPISEELAKAVITHIFSNPRESYQWLLDSLPQPSWIHREKYLKEHSIPC